MALRIEDVSSLPGRTIVDQEGEEVGEIKDVYGVGDDGDPMWLVLETHTGGMAGEDKLRIVPLARVREEDGNLSVPYSTEHVQDSPEVEVEDEISEEDDEKLRIYYSIDLADQEFRNEPRSYAAQVPEGKGKATKITDDLDDKEVPGGDTKADEEDESGDEDESGGDEDESGGDEEKSGGDEEKSGGDEEKSGGDDEDSDDEESSGPQSRGSDDEGKSDEDKDSGDDESGKSRESENDESEEEPEGDSKGESKD